MYRTVFVYPSTDSGFLLLFVIGISLLIPHSGFLIRHS